MADPPHSEREDHDRYCRAFDNDRVAEAWITLARAARDLYPADTSPATRVEKSPGG